MTRRDSASRSSRRAFPCLFLPVTPTTEIYTLSLHDALPICLACDATRVVMQHDADGHITEVRSEEHTSELQSPDQLVCRLLLEKKKWRCPSTCHPTANATCLLNSTTG